MVATLSILMVALLSAVLVGIAVCKRRAKSSLAKSSERLMPQDRRRRVSKEFVRSW